MCGLELRVKDAAGRTDSDDGQTDDDVGHITRDPSSQNL